MASDRQKAKSVLWYHESKYLVEVQRFGTEFGRECPPKCPHTGRCLVRLLAPKENPPPLTVNDGPVAEVGANFERLLFAFQEYQNQLPDGQKITPTRVKVVKVSQQPAANSDIASKTSSLHILL